jgi:hypothetical protein
MNLRRYTAVIATVLLALLLSNTGAATSPQYGIFVTVSAGKWDRHNTLVSFPNKSKPGTLAHLVAMKDGSSPPPDALKAQIPLQVDGTTATFVLPELKAGKNQTFLVVYGPAESAQTSRGAELTLVQNRVEIKVSGREVLSFVGKPAKLPSPDIKTFFLRGGYIHPVFTPKGKIVTDDYPSDHYHHHGIWFAWTKTEFEGKHPDFWNVGDNTGRVDFENVGKTWAGPVYAGFNSYQKYVALTGGPSKTALNEEWDVRVYDLGNEYFVFDIVATQECASKSPLILDEYRYGGMGVRGNREWKDKSKVSFLTSEGKTRADGNATRGRWCHIGGPVDGQLAGIAVLDHPSNFRAPTPMRINPDDPFFNYAPSQLGRFQIDPGKKFVLRYRYVVSDGPPDVKLLERLWNDYANPPVTSVVAM